MQQSAEIRSQEAPASLNAAYRWVAAAFALLVVVQAFLGTRGFFDGQAGFISMHELLANTMFLLVIGQTALSWMLYTKSSATMIEVGMNVTLVILTIAQIGLGYSTRSGENFSTVISLHIPNGVLMMGVSSVVLALAWRNQARQS